MSGAIPSDLPENKLLLTHGAGAPTYATIFAVAEKIKLLPEHETRDCKTVKIAIAGSLTTSFMARAIIYALAQEGVRGVVYESLYGSYIQEILDPHSALHGFKPDMLLIAPDWRDIVVPVQGGAAATVVMDALEPKLALLENLWAAAPRGSLIIQQTIVAPAWELCGVAERVTPSGEYWQVDAFNRELLRRGRGQVNFLDLRILAESIGLRNWAPEKLYIYGKLPFDSRFMPDYAQMFRSLWRATVGREKKCLVLDLDNTLWGGVIGDDGVEGIKIGAGSMAGEAFAQWGRYILRLKHRGVVLAVCSKNDPAIARQGFDHAGSVFKLDDFAVFCCSWNDKAQGIAGIAADLNIGLDAIVFCDDNPAECAVVRRALPEVAVIELGDDPTDFIRRLETGCWFFRQSLTAEDATRADAYAARGKALAAQAGAVDLDGFLRDLKMVAVIARPSAADMERVAQLEAKTNQFNLLTPRFTLAQIEEFASQPDSLLYAVRLSDIHGDHGLIASLIAVRAKDCYIIESWVMSCRVFSRGVEQLMMARLMADARASGAVRLIGRYRRTEKNSVVADLYAKMGFHHISENDGTNNWAFDLSENISLPHFIGAAA